MAKTSKSDNVPPKKNSQVQAPPNASECESCGLSYCDCEVCDSNVTLQVPPAKSE